MKKLAVLAMAIFAVALNLNAADLAIRRPTLNQEFRVGDILGLEWQHSPAHAEKEVNLKISIMWDEDTIVFRPPLTLEERTIFIPGPVSGNTFTWKVPTDFVPGMYKIYITELENIISIGSGEVRVKILSDRVEPMLRDTAHVDPLQSQAIAAYKVILQKPRRLSAFQSLTKTEKTRTIESLGYLSVHFMVEGTTTTFSRIPISPLADQLSGRVILDSLNIQLPVGDSYIFITAEKLSPTITGDVITTILEDLLFEDADFKNPVEVMGITTTAHVQGYAAKINSIKIEQLILEDGTPSMQVVLSGLGLSGSYVRVEVSTDLVNWGYIWQGDADRDGRFGFSTQFDENAGRAFSRAGRAFFRSKTTIPTL